MSRNVEHLLRQQAALAAFGSFAFQETDLTTILDEAARICANSLGVRHCKICRYREAENDLLIEAGFGWNAGVVGKIVSAADESSPQGRAFVTGEPVIVHNLRQANGYEPPEFYAEHGIVSTVDVLIKAHVGMPFGVLEVDSTDQQNYDDHDIDFLTGFANVLAEAVATNNRNTVLQATINSMTAIVAEKNRLLEERNLLALELQHRVRNNLQLVNGMLNEQLRHTQEGGERHGLRGIMQRVMSLAEVYEHLLGIGMSDQIDLGAYAKALCANLPNLQPPPAFPVALHCHAEEVLVDLAAATALGLVLTELISNSYEHAFPGKGGTITVRVGQDEQGSGGAITVADDGTGYVTPIETKRHGIGLARRLMQQVGGTLDLATTLNRGSSGGTMWTLRFPALALTEAV